MEAKLILAILAVALVIGTGTLAVPLQTVRAQETVISAPNAESARVRASKYYAALQSSDFPTAWTYFGSRMRTDTPRDEYVTHAKGAIRSVRVVRQPQVYSLTTGAPRAVASIRTEVVYVGATGDQEPATEVTEWIWQKSPDSNVDDWFIARDSLIGAKPAGT